MLAHLRDQQKEKEEEEEANKIPCKSVDIADDDDDDDDDDHPFYRHMASSIPAVSESADASAEEKYKLREPL